MVISVGLVGPKARAKAVVDGHLVNIPEPRVIRPGELALTKVKFLTFGLISRLRSELGIQ